jgi:AraC-like DNA-binding protein
LKGDPVLTEDYLNLRLVRLKASEQWARAGEGVAFVFPCAGSGQFLKASVAQPLSCGDVLVSNVDGNGKICPAKSGEFAFWAFSVRVEHLFPLFASTEISMLQSVVDGFRNFKIYPRSTPLAGECHKLLADIPPQFNLDHRGQLLRLAAAILNEEFKVSHGQRVGFVRAEDHLVQVFEKLTSEEMLSLSVPELAERFGCSRRHLNRLFHQHFGFSVAALRMEMRLMKAISLLRDRDAKVINVAEQCGFNHLGLFNTCFRRRFGTSPGQWRKAAAEKPANCGTGRATEQECPLKLTGLCPWPNHNGHAVQPVIPPDSRSGRKINPRVPAVAPGVDLEITVAAAQKANRVAFQVRAQK